MACPGRRSDVLIYSGGNDNVTLNVNATINSLTLGGAPNGRSSVLTDGGLPWTLSITSALTVGQTGQLIVNGGSNLTAGTLTNSGLFDTSGGSTTNIVGNAFNDGKLTTGYKVGGNNTLNISGALTNYGSLYVYGNGDIVNVGTLVNNGILRGLWSTRARRST